MSNGVGRSQKSTEGCRGLAAKETEPEQHAAAGLFFGSVTAVRKRSLKAEANILYFPLSHKRYS